MHHYNTILSQMLKMFSRHEFQKTVSDTGTQYHARGFSSWNHFVFMLFGQLAGVDSLRGIEAGLATQSQYLYHLGVKPVHRSTLVYVNEHRTHELFKKMFEWMLSKCQPVAPSVPLESGDVIVFDRGCNDFAWFKTLVDKCAFFVTRLKKRARYKIIERRSIHRKDIYSDQIIEFTGFYTRKKCPYRLRRIRSRDPETGKIIVILTNNFSWSAKTIALIYKDRWQIELFFKTIKQLLKVKSFVGTSQNARLSQLWAVLITYLLLAYLKFKSKFAWPLYTLCSILPADIFSKQNLWDWLNDPFHKPKSMVKLQYTLDFG